MTKKDYLIIGGGVAGTTSAEFIRMNDPDGSITIVMEEPEILFDVQRGPDKALAVLATESRYLGYPVEHQQEPSRKFGHTFPQPPLAARDEFIAVVTRFHFYLRVANVDYGHRALLVASAFSLPDI